MIKAVVDTGVLISGLIRPQGGIGDVLRGLRDGRFTAVYSPPMLMEIVQVLSRPVFKSKYHVEPNDITALINLLRLRGTLVIPKIHLTVCRDPKDTKFLEAAITGSADVIVTGDDDLLTLRSFEGTTIMRHADFVEWLSQ